MQSPIREEIQRRIRPNWARLMPISAAIALLGFGPILLSGVINSPGADRWKVAVAITVAACMLVGELALRIGRRTIIAATCAHRDAELAAPLAHPLLRPEERREARMSLMAATQACGVNVVTVVYEMPVAIGFLAGIYLLSAWVGAAVTVTLGLMVVHHVVAGVELADHRKTAKLNEAVDKDGGDAINDLLAHDRSQRAAAELSQLTTPIKMTGLYLLVLAVCGVLAQSGLSAGVTMGATLLSARLAIIVQSALIAFQPRPNMDLALASLINLPLVLDRREREAATPSNVTQLKDAVHA